MRMAILQPGMEEDTLAGNKSADRIV